MPDFVFILLIGVLGIIATILSSKGGLYDRRYNWKRVIRPRGWVIVMISLCIIGLSGWQAVLSKNDEKEKQKFVERQQFLSDSTIKADIQKGVVENRRQLFQDLSEALAGQNLKLDTVSNTIEKLRDSLKIFPISEDPFLIIESDAISHKFSGTDTCQFKVDLKCNNSEAKNLTLSCYIQIVKENGEIVSRGPLKTFDIDRLSVSVVETSSYTFPTLGKFRQMYYAIWGTYNDTRTSKLYKVQVVHLYFPETKENAYLQKPFADNFFRRNNLTSYLP